MARVARALLGRERARHRDLAAVPLPVGEAARQRMHRGVAELGERLRGEGGAVARGAVQDDRRLAVRDGGFDPRLEEAAGDMHRGRDMAFLPFVRLADVDPDGAWQLLRLAGVDLGDLRLRARQQLTIRAHNFPNGSGTFAYSRYLPGRCRPPPVCACSSALPRWRPRGRSRASYWRPGMT